MIDTLVIESTHTAPMAFAEVVADYKKTVYYLSLDLTGNHHDAEDLSQEVFIKAYRNLHRFRGEASMKTWLYRIAVNTYLNKRRKKALRFMRLWDDAKPDEPTTDTMRPDQQAVASTVQQHIEQALRHLSPRERSAFVLRHYQELSVREVADALDVAEGTVKSLLFRGTKKLQTHLAFYKKDLNLHQ